MFNLNDPFTAFMVGVMVGIIVMALAAMDIAHQVIYKDKKK